MKIGFIGCGSMGSGMIRGILASKQAAREDLAASARTESSKKRIREELGIRCATNEEIASASDLIVLAIKPQGYKEVISRIRPLVKDSVILLEQIRTIDKSRLKEKVCHLDDEILDKINHALCISLALDDRVTV